MIFREWGERQRVTLLKAKCIVNKHLKQQAVAQLLLKDKVKTKTKKRNIETETQGHYSSIPLKASCSMENMKENYFEVLCFVLFVFFERKPFAGNLIPSLVWRKLRRGSISICTPYHWHILAIFVVFSYANSSSTIPPFQSVTQYLNI